VTILRDSHVDRHAVVSCRCRDHGRHHWGLLRGFSPLMGLLQWRRRRRPAPNSSGHLGDALQRRFAARCRRRLRSTRVGLRIADARRAGCPRPGPPTGLVRRGAGERVVGSQTCDARLGRPPLRRPGGDCWPRCALGGRRCRSGRRRRAGSRGIGGPFGARVATRWPERSCW